MNANAYSVKTTIYHTSPSGRRSRRDFDGPWKATPAEAVEAYKASLLKKHLVRPVIASAFLAERVDEKVAGSQDSKGVYYNGSKVIDVQAALTDAGLNCQS